MPVPLSEQHLQEFHAAGMDADLYSKEGKSLFAGKNIDAAIESLTTMVIPRDYLIVRFP